MSISRVVDGVELDELVHAGRHVRISRSLLQVRGGYGQPSLGLERTVVAGVRPTLGAVVLVHGLAQNHKTWRLSQRSFVAALADQGWEVFNVDLRGHGWSRRFGAPPATSVDEYVDDLCRVIEAIRPQSGRPFVVGHSLGAAVSVRAAPRVDMAGLVHLAGIYAFASQNRMLRGIAKVTKRLDLVIPNAMHVDTRLVGNFIAKNGRIIDRAFDVTPMSGWATRSFERELMRERVVDGFDRSAMAIWKEMARWALEEEPVDIDGAFARLDRPLLVLTGDADNLAHPADGRAAYQASASSDRTYVNFTKAVHGYSPGHLDIILGRRAPEVVWPVMMEWLRARSDHAVADEDDAA